MGPTLLLVVGVLLVGCDSNSTQQLDPGVFVSESVDLQTQQPQLFDGVEVTVEVERIDGESSVSWQATCNIGFAPARLDDGRLELTDVVSSTAMACDEPKQTEQDDRLEEFFTSGPRWERDGDVLRVRSEDGTSKIVLERRAGDSEQ